MDTVIKPPRFRKKKFNKEFWQHVIMLLRTGELTSMRLFGVDSDTRFRHKSKQLNAT